MIYKRGKLYWYKFMWNGTLVRESTKQGNDKVARSMESAHRTSLPRAGIGGASNMKRRNFIGTLTLAAGAALFPLPALPSRKIEYLEDVSSNYRAWREALIEKVAKKGYKFRSASLERPVGGFRRATLHVTDETGTAKTLTWFQPWRGGRIDQ